MDRDQRSEVGDLRSEIGGQKRGLAQRRQGAKIRIVSHPSTIYRSYGAAFLRGGTGEGANHTKIKNSLSQSTQPPACRAYGPEGGHREGIKIGGQRSEV